MRGKSGGKSGKVGDRQRLSRTLVGQPRPRGLISHRPGLRGPASPHPQQSAPRERPLATLVRGLGWAPRPVASRPDRAPHFRRKAGTPALRGLEWATKPAVANGWSLPSVKSAAVCRFQYTLHTVLRSIRHKTTQFPKSAPAVTEKQKNLRCIVSSTYSNLHPRNRSIFQSKNEPEIGPGGKGQAAG